VPKQCERPGCSGPAEVLYGFNPAQLLVWLEKGPIPEGSRANALCRRHADALAVPKGWYIDDRREPAPRLFSSPAKSNVVQLVPVRSHKRKGPPKQKGETFQDLATEVAPEKTTASELAETKAIPWTPRFDKDDDLGGVLRPNGRLMSRAFGLDETKSTLRDVSQTDDLEREPFNENDIP